MQAAQISEILFEVVKLAIMIISALVARYLIPWLKTRVDMDKVKQVSDWSKEAVHAAQQLMNDKTGEERKQFVLNSVQAFMLEKGIEITDEQLEILIEAAVKQMKQKELDTEIKIIEQIPVEKLLK